MRKTLFATAALFGLAIAAPAFAQGMTPEQYLKQAQQAVRDHHRMTALMAVNNAENELLRDRAASESHGTRDVAESDPPVIRQMGRAREAIQERHWTQAETYLSDAMAHPSASVAGNPAGATPAVGQAGSKQQ